MARSGEAKHGRRGTKGGDKLIYEWKQSRFPVKAQTAGEELERINKAYGGIELKNVVNESRPKKSVLHKCFEWNDNVAAEKYRESQAGEIVRTIVTVPSETDKTEPIRAFVSVITSNERVAYIGITEAMNNEDYSNQILQKALSELQTFKRKYQSLSELKNLFLAINNLV